MLRRAVLCLVASVATCGAFVKPYKSHPYERPILPLLCHKKSIKVAFVGGGLFWTGPAFAQDSVIGEQIFNSNCAGCHAGGKNAIVANHTLEKDAIEKYLTDGFNEKAIVYQITNGKNAMPAFGGRLSDQDISNVAAFGGRLSDQDISNVAAYVLKTAEDRWD